MSIPHFIIKFEKDIFLGLTPMIFVSAASHFILFILIVFISSNIPKTTNLPEPVFTVTLSAFPSPTSGTSKSLLSEVEEPEKIEVPAPPKKEPITLPDRSSKESQAQDKKKKKSSKSSKANQEDLASLPPSSKALHESSGIHAGTMGDGSGEIIAAGIENFEYVWYRAMVISKLKENWIKPVLPFRTTQPFQVTVLFIIERDGSVSRLEIDCSSGYPPLDRSAIRAVYDSSPFPPLPIQIDQSNLQARFIFELKQE